MEYVPVNGMMLIEPFIDDSEKCAGVLMLPDGGKRTRKFGKVLLSSVDYLKKDDIVLFYPDYGTYLTPDTHFQILIAHGHIFGKIIDQDIVAIRQFVVCEYLNFDVSNSFKGIDKPFDINNTVETFKVLTVGDAVGDIIPGNIVACVPGRGFEFVMNTDAGRKVRRLIRDEDVMFTIED
jgi:hypothetical protein